MSNVFSSISNNLAMLKNYYQGPIVNQFNEQVPIYRGAEKVKQGWSGFQVVRPLRVRRNLGIGATTDGGTLPAIGKQTTVQATISAKFNYLRFGVTGPMIKASASDVGSFVRAASYELEMGFKDLVSDANRQCSWDGTSDLAVVSANAVASNTITVTGRESTEDGNRFLEVGMVLDIYSAAGVLVEQAVSIVTLTGTTTATLVLDRPVTCSATDILVRSGSFGNEISGLLYALDGGTSSIYGVNRSTYPSFQGNVNNMAGGQLTLDGMQKAYNDALRRGAAKLDAAYCDYDSLRFYQKLLVADKRYSNTIKGDGGFAEKDKFYLDFNSIPMVPDKDCPRRIFFLPSDTFKFYVLSEMEFADETGSMYIAQTDNDQLETRIRFFADLFNEQPNACAVVYNYISP